MNTMTTNHYFLLGSDLGSNPRPNILGSDRLDKCITKDWSKMTGKFEIFTVKECLLQNFQVFFLIRIKFLVFAAAKFIDYKFI